MKLAVSVALSVAAFITLFATTFYLAASLMALVALVMTFDRYLLKEPDHEHRDTEDSADRAHHYR